MSALEIAVHALASTRRFDPPTHVDALIALFARVCRDRSGYSVTAAAQ